MSLNQEIIKIKSTALENNYLNDPVEREILVFHPDKIVDNSPLLIELAGLNGTPKLNNRFSQVLNKLYKKDLLKNSVIINPNFSTKYHVNQYMNSPAAGNYEDFIINEIIPYISDLYHTGNIALFGKSSGGFGAYTLAVKHPDVISGFADHFGDSCFEYVYIPDIPVAYRELHDRDISDYLTEKSKKDDLTDNEIRTLNIIGMSAFYSHNEDSELKFDLPFERDTGSLKHDIWNKWIEYDPAKNVVNYINSLKKLKAIYLDVGADDEYSLFIGMAQLHKKMEKNSIEHKYEKFKGGHFYNTTRYETSLPFLINKLSE